MQYNIPSDAMSESVYSRSEGGRSASPFAMSFADVEDLATVVDAYGDEEQTIPHSNPGGVPWSDEDKRAMRRIDWDFLCMLDVSQKPDFEQLIQEVLDSRWNRIKDAFLADIKRPDTARDDQKYFDCYDTRIASNDKILDELMLRNAGFDRGVREHIARVVQPGVDLERKSWTRVSTVSKPRTDESKAVVRSLIAVFGDRVIVIVTEAFAETDRNQYVERLGEAATFRAPSGHLAAVAPIIKESRALPISELLFRHIKPALESDENVLDLVWHFNITNPMTRRTILGAHQEMGWGGRCWGRFRADGGGAGNNDQDRKAKEQKEFRNLVVTDNGRSLVWMLSDHREMFRERIKEVYTFPVFAVPGSERFHMVFKLGKVEKVF
ncbi:hypothetical protein E6O75_ATG05878 [Venturia nashicola]|uniref:Uncharacterized protein n=1 Tax=Venturia nashicola TaxID=86259 RepID=A0A4Z1NVU6_9PEZI|nr:hypothetical protein E6O75_ATG05878 [Venturia nashicola]